MQRFSSTAERAGLSRTALISVISSRTGVVRLISMGLGAHGIRISSTYRSADRAMPGWSSSCGVSMITTSSAWAISGTRRCSSRDGRATIRNGNAASDGVSRGSIYARSDHSRALPEGSASTRSTLYPACAKTWASQTADVVLPVPGLRLARATLKAGTATVLQYLLHYRSTARSRMRSRGTGCGPFVQTAWCCQQPVDVQREYRCEVRASCRPPVENASRLPPGPPGLAVAGLCCFPAAA